MRPASLRLEQFPSIIRHIGGVMDIAASARRHRALLRRRGVRSAEDLLHLALLYGPGGLSLRSAASFATEAGIADLCDVSLLDRLRNAGASWVMSWRSCWPPRVARCRARGTCGSA